MQKRHNEAFTVTDYRLPPEFPVAWTLEMKMSQPGRAYLPRPHLDNVIEIGYCHEGRGVFSVADKLLPFQAGDVVVINHLEPHYAANSRGIVSTWTWIFFDPPRLFGAMPVPPALLDVSRLCGPEFNNIMRNGDIAATVRLVVEELRENRAGMRESVRGLLISLLCRLHRLEGRSRAGKSVAGKRQSMERLTPALVMIQQEYSGKISAGALAKACNMSETYFRQHFMKAFGRSPYQYLQQYRLSMACSELEDSRLTVEAIAEKHGFPTLSCFVRIFRRVKGLPPRRWARKAAAG